MYLNSKQELALPSQFHSLLISAGIEEVQSLDSLQFVCRRSSLALITPFWANPCSSATVDKPPEHHPVSEVW